jgi:hypothetical protein
MKNQNIFFSSILGLIEKLANGLWPLGIFAKPTKPLLLRNYEIKLQVSSATF